MKICSTCKLLKDFSCFNKNKKLKDGLCYECKQCKKQYNSKRYLTKQQKIKTLTTLYRIQNKEKISTYQKQYRIKNLDKLNHYRENYYYSEENKNNKKRANKIYRDKNKTNIKINKRKWEIENYKNNIQFRLSFILRKRLNMAIKGNFKNGSAIEDLGCSIVFLKQYLESKFQLGMSWNNHTQFGWHIDHIMPLSSFDLTDREQFLKACHYTNLQPMWWQENLSKGSKINDAIQSI